MRIFLLFLSVAWVVPKTNAIHGSWELVHWSATRDGQSSFYPYGEDARGNLRYDERGEVLLMLMKAERTPEEIENGKGFFAYTGSFSVDSENSRVFHLVELCSDPSWIGKEQKRLFSFSGDTLILTSPPVSTRVSDQQPAVHTLKWLKR